MKIVIDIPEDVYKRTIFYREFKELNDCITTIKALEKATPLPKGHGRLIDKDKMIADLLTVDPQYEEMIDWSCRVTEAQPTIIEADRECGE